jgi:hypothetical protein
VTSYDGQVGGFHAGTPVNQLSLKDGGGATGGGGSNYTGSYSGTASFTPCGPTPPTIYLGYADSYPVRPIQPNFPSPWKGSASTFSSQPVLFVGCGFNGASDQCPLIPGTGNDWYDAGSIRIDNPPTGAPLAFTGSGSNVTIGICTFTPWNGVSATDQPGQTMILTQTGGPDPCGPQIQAKTGINVVPLNYPPNENLDTSESYAQSQNYLNFVQGGPAVCSNDGLIPQIALQINGGTVTINDNNQITNDTGVDQGGPICGVPFTADSTNGSNVLHNVKTPQGGTTALVANAAVTGAGFANGFTTGIAITSVNAAADTITVSEAANATQPGLILQELFSESEQWSSTGVAVSAPSGFAHDVVLLKAKSASHKHRVVRKHHTRKTHQRSLRRVLRHLHGLAMVLR